MGVHTDLALEAKEIAERDHQPLPGVESEEQQQNDIHIHMVRIVSDEGSKRLNKPQGQYITLECEQFKDIVPDTKTNGAKSIAEQLKRIRPVDKNEVVLVVGLGNPAITADSLGPKLTQHILVTRHIKMLYPDGLDQRLSNVSALVPGVLGITGIETGEIIKGVAEKIKPALIIVIDALAAGETRRIASTVQLSDAGIHPGSGVGNHRMELTKQSLGTDIIAIGVPTVVYARTVARDAMMGVSQEIKRDGVKEAKKFPYLGEVNPQDADNLLDQTLDDEMKRLVVAPKDIDQLIDKMAEMVADGLNQYLHYECTPDVIAAYM
jgi:spore protease